MKHQVKFMEVELSGSWKPTGTDVQEADRRFDSDEVKRYSDENDITRFDTKGLGEINLLDILYNRGCIPLKKKKAMERAAKDLRNRELFHVLVNGSIKTFEILSNFLKVTHQIRMLDILVGNYVAEGGFKCR